MRKAAALLIAALLVACCGAFGQETAVEVFQRAQSGEYFDTKDDQQDWLTFFIYREMDLLREMITANEEARREDDKELRAQIWRLMLIVGGGGAVAGGGGTAVARIMKRGK